MSVTNDNRYAQIRSYGYTGSLYDMLFKYYGDNGAVGGEFIDREMNWLLLQGYSNPGIQNRWQAYLKGLGYTGSLQDMMYAASIVSGGSIGGALFSPRIIFLGGADGAWYEPRDFSSMYQDSIGTTPVTAVEQPEGLGLDKRLGLVRGPEIWNDAGVTFSDSSSRVSPNVYRVYSPAGTLSEVLLTSSLTVGKTYAITFTIDSITTLGSGVRVGSGGAIFTTTGLKTAVYVADVGSTAVVKRVGGVTDIQISGVSFKLLDGNHALQATAAARPVLKNTGGPLSLLFDGVDDSLSSATGGGGTAGFFWCGAFRLTGGAGTYRTIFGDRGSGNSGYFVQVANTNRLSFGVGRSGGFDVLTPTADVINVGDLVVATVWDDGANLNVQLGNGTIDQLAHDAPVAGNAGITIGKHPSSATEFFPGNIYAQVYVKNSGLTAAQRLQIKNYVAAQAGITI